MYALDRIDLALLDELQQDSKQSIKKLSEIAPKVQFTNVSND